MNRRILSFLRFLLPSRRSLRLSAYCLFVFGLLSLSAARLLHARVGETALSLGEGLSGFAELARDAETVLIGGVRFRHSRVVLAEPVSAALDRIERECESHPGPLAVALTELAARAGVRLDHYGFPAVLRRGSLRYERDGRGVLICFAAARAETPRNLEEQVREFAGSRDLSAFGRVRYAFAEPSAEGRTCLTSMWSDDALELGSLFPESGDSAGNDPSVVPRPPNSRRVLSVAAERLPYGLWLYTGGAPARDALAFYEAWLGEHGFRRVAQNPELGAVAYLRADGLQVFVSTAQDDAGTTVGLVESASAESSISVQSQNRE